MKLRLSHITLCILSCYSFALFTMGNGERSLLPFSARDVTHQESSNTIPMIIAGINLAGQGVSICSLLSDLSQADLDPYALMTNPAFIEVVLCGGSTVAAVVYMRRKTLARWYRALLEK